MFIFNAFDLCHVRIEIIILLVIYLPLSYIHVLPVCGMPLGNYSIWYIITSEVLSVVVGFQDFQYFDLIYLLHSFQLCTGTMVNTLV